MGPKNHKLAVMTFAESIQSVFRNFRNFSGRASRSEYWFFYLFVVLVNLLTTIPLVYTATMVNNPWYLLPFLVAAGAVWLFLILPVIAVTARRLHDTNLSAWFMLLFLLPGVGGLIQIIMLIQPGTPSSNRFG